MRKKLLLFCIFIIAGSFSLPAQIITTFAGIGPSGSPGTFSGDGGLAIDAGLSDPSGVAADSIGNVYIGNGHIFRIRKVSVTGIISAFAGTGTNGYTGDNGPATAAEIGYPGCIAVDRAGNMYYSDQYNFVIRKVNPSGIISTFAGNGAGVYSGDGGPATMAGIGIPGGIAADTSGNIYIAAGTIDRVRKVVTATGIITTIAGTGGAGFGGDGGPATADSVLLNSPVGVVMDHRGNLYITDLSNFRIRRVNAAGIITTIAGTGTSGHTGDGGPATNAQLIGPYGIAVDDTGSVFFSDGPKYVRKVDTSGIITTIAGIGTLGFSGDGGPATAAEVDDPRYVATHGQNIYLSDAGNNRVRRIGAPVHPPYFINGDTIKDTICSTPVFIDTLLKSFEADTGEVVTWTLISGPFHGTAFTPCSVWSAGDTLYPLSLTYVPGAGYTGSDTLSVWLTNGYASDTATVYLTVIHCNTAVPTLPVAAGNEALKVYPNPNNGSFTINISSNTTEEAHLIITNMVGEKIKEMTAGTNTLQTIQIDVPPGVYFLNAVTKEGRYNAKIIVEK